MIGYIPSRSGSKRIPFKNLQQLGAHSLVEAAVIRAYNSGLNPIYVSSESSDLLQQINVKYPFIPLLRDPSCSCDFSSISSALISDLYNIVDDKSEPICIIQPSNPFCTVESLGESALIFSNSQFSSLVSGFHLPYSHYEISSKTQHIDSSVVPYTSIAEFKSLIFIDGNFVFTTLDHCIEFSSAWNPTQSFVYIQNNHFVIDIDEPNQLSFARACWPTWLSMHNQTQFYD